MKGKNEEEDVLVEMSPLHIVLDTTLRCTWFN